MNNKIHNKRALILLKRILNLHKFHNKIHNKFHNKIHNKIQNNRILKTLNKLKIIKIILITQIILIINKII